MITKKVFSVVAYLFIFSAYFSSYAWAGPLVYGPKKYVRDTGKPVSVVETFTVDKSAGKFWLQVSNGGTVQKPGKRPGVVEPVDQVSSAYIKLNGVQILGPEDLNQNVYGFSKDITLLTNNTIEVEVRGKPGSYINLEIRKAELNMNIDNTKGDLRGSNMRDQIVLWWSLDPRVTEYVIYKSYSIDGTWLEWERSYAGEPTNTVDITPEAQTMELCYKIEALDSQGKVIRRYEPICVPKWQEEESSLPLAKATASKLSELHGAKTRKERSCNAGGDSRGSPSLLPHIMLASLSTSNLLLAQSGSAQNSTQSSSSPYNDMCLSDSDFEDYNSMDASEIQNFLRDKGSFLREPINDVDGDFIHPHQIIYNAAQTYRVSPQVLLTTLQKEQGAILAKNLLPDSDLKLIMGYNTVNPTTIEDQIYDAASQMRRDFDRLSNGHATAGGWQVGVAKNSLDPLSVTPANNAVAILFTYTPWVGQGWGGRKGGNALFCQLWQKYKFGSQCPETPAEITISGSDAPVDGNQYSANGGTAPYTWSISKGSITQGGVVTVSGQCGTATITVTDACGTTQQKDITLSSYTYQIPISGPDSPTDGSQYTASGGVVPYTWSITKGSITTDGVVTVSGECGTATITVKDKCDVTAEKVVTLPVVTGVAGPVAPVDGSQYTAITDPAGSNLDIQWSISKGSITQTGVVTVSGQCGTATVTAADTCGNQATKDVRMSLGVWVWISQRYSACFGGDLVLDNRYLFYYGSWAGCSTIEGGFRTDYSYGEYSNNSCTSYGSLCQNRCANFPQCCSMDIVATCSYSEAQYPNIVNGRSVVTDGETVYEWRCP